MNECEVEFMGRWRKVKRDEKGDYVNYNRQKVRLR